MTHCCVCLFKPISNANDLHEKKIYHKGQNEIWEVYFIIYVVLWHMHVYEDIMKILKNPIKPWLLLNTLIIKIFA